jgi:hypothetical protein
MTTPTASRARRFGQAWANGAHELRGFLHRSVVSFET